MKDHQSSVAVHAYRVLHCRASFEIDPPGADEMYRRRIAVVGRGFPYLVAEQAGAVVGYAYASAYRAREACANTVESSVYLRPDAVGRGIGRCLVSALIEVCERPGFRQMVAVVGDSANEASVRLHRKLGFRFVGVMRDVGFKHGVWLDNVLLQRRLGPGRETPPSRNHV